MFLNEKKAIIISCPIRFKIDLTSFTQLERFPVFSVIEDHVLP